MEDPRDPMESREEDLELRSRMCSVFTSTSTCGVAFYSELDGNLVCDSFPYSSSGHMEAVIRSFKKRYNPTLWLLPPKVVSNTPLLNIILSSPEDQSENYYPYTTQKSSSWTYEIALQTICSQLYVRELYNSGNQGNNREIVAEHNYHLLAAVLDLQNQELCQALGALLQNLLAHPSNNKVHFVVNRVLRSDKMSYMQIDRDSLRSLSVFTEEHHPNIMRGKGRVKEGLSLFALLDRTRSQQGRQRLRYWMEMPFCEKAQIERRLDGVEMMTKPINIDWCCEISAHLRRLQDIPALLLKIKKAEANFQDWIHLHTSLYAAVSIAESIQELIAERKEDAKQTNRDIDKDCVYLLSLYEGIDIATLQRNFHSIEHVIDFEKSTVQEELVVNEGYDAALDAKREIYETLEDCLRKAALDILDTYPDIDKCGVEYVPQVGFLISIDRSSYHIIDKVNQDLELQRNRLGTQGIPMMGTSGAMHRLQRKQQFQQQYGTGLLPPNAQIQGGNRNPTTDHFEYIYEHDDTLMYKNATTRILDDSIGDIRHEISDMQRIILLQVEDELLECEPGWQQLADMLASLDATMSLGIVANERNFVRPDISENKTIAVKGGRHPLQELTVDRYIANDIFLHEEKHIAIVTGANSSGKSVYLKQIGLIVYMAHIGSFVPCEKALIGLIDSLFTRISTLESASTPQSSFTMDLCQMSHMLKAYTPRSLCLVDEFGKGTSPIDGVALLASTIQHFAEEQTKARIVFVLHFTEVFSPGILSQQTLDKLMCFKMQIYYCEAGAESDAIDQADQVPDEQQKQIDKYGEDCINVPLFNLVLGISPTSEGFACATSAGVDEVVVKRAKHIKNCLVEHKSIDAIVASTKFEIQSQSPSEMRMSTNTLKLLQEFLAVDDYSKNDAKTNAALDKILTML